MTRVCGTCGARYERAGEHVAHLSPEAQAARWPDGREMRRKLAQGETIRRYLVEIDTHELGDPDDLGGTVMRERLDPFDSADPPRDYTIDWHEISAPQIAYDDPPGRNYIDGWPDPKESTS